MARGRKPDNFETVLIVLGVVGGLIGLIGFWPVGILILVVFAIALFQTQAESAASERARLANERAPCVHGVAYAKNDPKQCNRCEEAEQQRKAIEERGRVEEQKRLEQERKAREQEYALKIRRKEYLRKMNPAAFENLVCQLYRRMGYEVHPTKQTADGGSDGFLCKSGKNYVLQCKRVQQSVGEPVLRDLYGTMMHFECDGAVVVTTGRVSSAAKAWVRGKPIEVIEIEALQKLLRAHYPSDKYC